MTFNASAIFFQSPPGKTKLQKGVHPGRARVDRHQHLSSVSTRDLHREGLPATTRHPLRYAISSTVTLSFLNISRSPPRPIYSKSLDTSPVTWSSSKAGNASVGGP